MNSFFPVLMFCSGFGDGLNISLPGSDRPQGRTGVGNRGQSALFGSAGPELMQRVRSLRDRGIQRALSE